ncbi:hypothetical protein Vau01_066430 [Virgisporangium aurantiacum]|uniref:Uncharacterized protein n=1 Tax=Virgisporangium aurantiacum TaxID=175570 RepID=A0A8J4E4Q0_9ACTN|nr:hypothetical protein Vau01_066430 [Virgisporangium aurantiacum]
MFLRVDDDAGGPTRDQVGQFWTQSLRSCVTRTHPCGVLCDTLIVGLHLNDDDATASFATPGDFGPAHVGPV